MSQVLLVEDEQAIAENVLYALESEGFETLWYQLGHEGLAALREHPIDLVILDIGLPDTSGLELCKTIRRFCEVPIIFLTARSDEVERIVGLEIGADDYVTKPFSPRELAARVKVILRRSGHRNGGLDLQAGFGWSRSAARVTFHGRLLELTRTEYLLLTTLLAHPGQVFSRDRLMERVWDEQSDAMQRAVDTHIKALRAKLRAIAAEETPIRTHRGLGYSLEGEVHEY